MQSGIETVLSYPIRMRAPRRALSARTAPAGTASAPAPGAGRSATAQVTCDDAAGTAVVTLPNAILRLSRA